MPWTLLLDLRIWLAAALLATGAYAAVQRLAKAQCQAEFAQFRADTERLGAEAKIKNAQEAAQQAQHAQEALDDLSTRYASLDARYRGLQHAGAGSRPVPALSSAAPSLSACAGDASKPDAATQFLAEVESRITAILEAGDKELGKYVELWSLEQKNAAKP